MLLIKNIDQDFGEYLKYNKYFYNYKIRNLEWQWI